MVNRPIFRFTFYRNERKVYIASTTTTTTTDGSNSEGFVAFYSKN